MSAPPTNSPSTPSSTCSGPVPASTRTSSSGTASPPCASSSPPATSTATPEPDGHRAGAAYFEGQTEPVSIATAERFICTSGAIPILFDDDGKALNLGREQRLFTEKQRIALAARMVGA